MWTRLSRATTSSATRDVRDTVSAMNGSGMVKSGVVSAAAGMNRPRYVASPRALTAIAPEKPATNDVHPVRKAGSGPKAARR